MTFAPSLEATRLRGMSKTSSRISRISGPDTTDPPLWKYGDDVPSIGDYCPLTTSTIGGHIG